MSDQIGLLRVADAVLLRLAESLLEFDEDGAAELTSIGRVEIELNASSKLDRDTLSVFTGASYLITGGTISLPSHGFILRFYRGMSYLQRPNGTSWVKDNPFHDGLDINGPTKGTNRLAILAVINKFVALAPPIDLSPAGSSALDQSGLILNRVSEAAAAIAEHTADRQRDLDEYRREIDEAAAAQVAAERERLRAEHSVAEDALQARVAEFESKTANLDDRENTHVRRELQKSMAKISTEALEQPLLASSQTSFRRTEQIAIGFAFILIVLAGFQTVLLTLRPISDNLVYFGEVRVVLLGLGAGALIWYALRLGGTRHRQIGRWEHELHKFRLDTERASFLIEGELEARKTNGSALPEVMLDRFSRGLFSSSDGDSDRGGDEIGSTLGHLLSRAASVKVGTDGVSVEVDKSGIKKARKDVAIDGADE